MDDAGDQQTYLEWVGLLRGAAAYEAYSKVYTAWKQFRDQSHAWFATAERAYADFDSA